MKRKNNLVLLMLLLIFCTSLISAGLTDIVSESSMLKQDLISKDIIISDSANKYPAITVKTWFDFPFISEDIMDLVLTKHDEFCGPSCVSGGYTKLYKEGILFTGFDFYTILEDGKRVKQNIRSYAVYLKTGEEEYHEDVYEWQCKDTGEVDPKNGTKLQECNNIKTGTITKTRDLWEEYMIGEKRPAGEYIWELRGQKRPDRTVDFIPIVEGNNKIEEWSVWGEGSLSTGLEHYYKLDETTGKVAQDIVGGKNITFINDATFRSGGKINNAIYLDGTNDYGNTSSSVSALTGTGDFAVVLWHNSTIAQNGALWSLVDGDSHRIVSVGISVYRVFLGGVDTGNIGTQVMTGTQWNMLVVQRNNGYLNVYLNGTLIKNQSMAGDLGNSNFRLGSDGNGADDFAGMMDEVAIWNRSLTQAEITDLYNDGVGISYSTRSIGLNSPINNYISPSNLVTFNATATVVGGATLTNMSLWTNSTGSWARNQSRTIQGNYVKNEPAVAYTTAGTYNNPTGILINTTKEIELVNITVANSTSCLSYSLQYANRTNIKSEQINTATFASINVNLSANTEYYILMDECSGGNYYLYYSTTASFPYLGEQINIIGEWNGGGNDTSQIKMVKSITTRDLGLNSKEEIFDLNLTSPTKWGIEACDSDGDCGFSENRTVNIDTTAPTISIAYPTGTINGLTNGQSLALNYSATDSNLATCWRDYNGVNTTIGSCANTTFTYVSGVNSIKVWANDSVGNVGSDTESWMPSFVIQNSSYSNTAYETSTENFYLNVSYNSSALALSVKLNYDGTNYSTINLGSGDNGYFKSTLDIGLINSSSNKTFYWLLNNVPQIYYNQTVSPVLISVCNSTLNVTALNFTYYDESTLVEINASQNNTFFKGTFNYWFGTGTITKQYSYQNLSNPYSRYRFCIYPANLNNIKTNLDLEFGASNYLDNGFTLEEELLSNNTITKNLYLLPSTLGTKFTHTVREGVDLKPGVLVSIDKYFSGLGLYKNVGIKRTDVTGRFTQYLELDKQYNYTIYDGNITLSSIENTAICSVAPCEITLQIQSDLSDLLNEINAYIAQNVNYTLSYNTTTKMVNLNFQDLLGTAQYWRLYVYKPYFGNESGDTICNQTSYTVSGTMSCNYTGYQGTIMAKVYISRSPEKLVDFLDFLNEEVSPALGASGLLASIIILLIIVFAGARNPTNALIMLPFGFTLLKFLSFLPLSWGIIMAITVVCWIIAYKMKI